MMTGHFEAAEELSKILKSRRFDAVERWEKQRKKILELNPLVNAYITVFDKPLCRKDFRKRLLRGLTVAVKDVFHVSGYPTTAGSKLFANRVSSHTAPVVEKLLEAGAAVNGKTNLHEFAFGVSNINPHFGACKNPFDLARVSGGSSGGSAVAVALGMCDIGLGTDTAGSVRIPASFCGVVGFKPSIGSLSTEGVIPLSWSLDHVGTLSRSVWETAVAYAVMTNKVKEISKITPAKLERLKIGVPINYFLEYLSHDVREMFEQSLKKMEAKGAELVDIHVPDVEKAVRCRTVIGFAESSAYHLGVCKGNLAVYGEDVKQRIVAGLSITAVGYLTALRARKKLVAKFRQVFNQVDVLATPTTTITAHRIDEQEIDVDGKIINVRAATLRNTEPFNLYGVPSISIPMGFSSKGLPTGLQLVADFGEDFKLLGIAYGVEKLFKTSS
ncbi:MAG: amidase [Candidatus Caldarchaeum sp.]